jgi:hypothetical protein
MAGDNILIDIAKNDEKVKEDEIKGGFTIMAAVVGVLIIFVSLIGCCTGHLRNKICVGIYGFFAFVIMILMFLYGATALGFAALGDNYCAKERDGWSQDQINAMKEIDDWTEKADIEIGTVINDKMCSEMCPCYMGDTGENLVAYALFTEADLNKYGRTLLSEYDDDYDWIEEYTPMVWGFTEDESFESLDECMIYWDELSEEYGIENEEAPEISEENREFVRFFEEKY